MKTQLIITRDQMVLVSDEQIKEGDWYFDPISVAVYQRNKDLIEEYCGCLKIIAGIQELPQIILSNEDKEVVKKKYGWIDIESLSHSHAKKEWPLWTDSIQYEECRQNFIQGFKTALSLINHLSLPKIIDVEVHIECVGWETSTESAFKVTKIL